MSKKIFYLIFVSCIILIGSACSSSLSTQATSSIVVTRIPATDAGNPELIAASAENNPADKSQLACSHEDLICIGLIVSSGHIDDNAYNQSAWEALKRSEVDLQTNIDFIEVENASEFDSGIAYFADKDFDIIVTVGREIYASTVEAAGDYPDVDFIGVDQFEYQFLSNAVGLVFPDYQSGFLAGALAAMLTQTGIVGAVLGSESSVSIINFKRGFEDGANAINSDVQILSVHNPVKIGSTLVDPSWGAQTASELISQGADVILASAGESGDRALVEVANHSNALCIGVGADRWLTLPEARPCLVSSAMQEIPSGVFELIGWHVLGKMPTGEFQGRVELAPFHEFSTFIPADAKAVLNEIDAGLVNKTIPMDGSYRLQNAPLIFIDR